MDERVKRWHNEHVRVQAYVTKEEYAKIRGLASNMKVSVSGLVKRALIDIKRLEEETYNKGFNSGVGWTLNYIEEKGPWESCGIEEFTLPCARCGKPMVFSSRFEGWESRVKPILAKAFSGWAHTRCLSKVEGKT